MITPLQIIRSHATNYGQNVRVVANYGQNVRVVALRGEYKNTNII